MLKIRPNITATPNQEKELLEVIKVTEAIVNSEVFENEFLKLELTETKGLSNGQILDMIRQPHNVNFEFYNNPDSNALGAASERLQRIRFNLPHWGDLSANCLTLIHEFIHLLGFGHKNAFENKSVPYASGYLVRQMIWDYGYEEGKRLVYVRPWWLLWLFKVVRWL